MEAVQHLKNQVLSGEDALRAIQAQARYVFQPDEFARLTGRTEGSAAVKQALSRYARMGRIQLASKRPTNWLIVPPEQAHYGAPPVDWWLHDYLMTIEPHYYVALLSAARHWGSAHYALQTTQVMVGTQRAAQAMGRVSLEFVFKKNLESTPVDLVNTGVSRVRVSTREATLLDLLRHQDAVGGLEAIARISKDFAPDIDRARLTLALGALDKAPPAQRLGFILDHLGKPKLAQVVETWLEGKRLFMLALEGSTESAETSKNKRWGIEYTPQQCDLFEELA